MNYKKYTAAILSTLCLTACGNTPSVSEETTILSEITAETTSVVSESVTEISEITEEALETIAETIENNGIQKNPETGLVYFVQPSINPSNYTYSLDSWDSHDGEVLYGDIYEGEWRYQKELIFAFSNYTSEPVTVDSIQLIRDSDGAYMTFTNGSDTLDIDFTIESLHKTDYVLKSENFDYSACESGIYRTVVNIGGENPRESEFEFFINNCELYSDKYISEKTFHRNDDGNLTAYEYDVYAPTFLSEEQQLIFAKATGIMEDWFWCEGYMPSEYRDTHTPDDFLEMLYSVFTKEYADELAKSYINDDGEFLSIDGGRGSNIMFFDRCFMPVSSDENTVEFKAVVTLAHGDYPYGVSFDDNFHFVMKNTENGWRVERFSLWN